MLSISDHELDRNRSSEPDNEVEHIWRRLQQFKKIEIKMESSKQTKISIWIVISYISSCSRCVHRYIYRFKKCIMHIRIFVVYYLLGITPYSIFISNANACIYTKYMAVGFHLPLSLFGFLSIHIPIFYLFTIILIDYSNNPPLNSKGCS